LLALDGEWLVVFVCIRYDSALLKDMKAALLIPFALFLVSQPALHAASDTTKPPPATSAAAEFSADNFDWREIVPYLFVAATLPEEQGIKAVLENCKVLRTYVRGELHAECNRDQNLCAAKPDGATLDEEVSKRIDDIVKEGIFRRHKTAIVDYQLSSQSFPFSEIAALKSEQHPDAYLLLELAGRNYKSWQVQAKYGDPYDTDIVQWYSVYKYRIDNPRYSSKAVFEIDPVDGSVVKLAISLKPKKGR
jgi:hypothetical protein